MPDKEEAKCACDLNKALCDASEEELTEFYERITGLKPKPEQIKAMKGMCKLGPGIEITKAEGRLPALGSKDPTEREDALFNRVLDGLDKSVSEEHKAASDYGIRASEAAQAKDAKTSNLYLHIMGEEQHHGPEFEARKKELGG